MSPVVGRISTTISVNPVSLASFKSRVIFSRLLAKSEKLAAASIQIYRGFSLLLLGGSGNSYSGSVPSSVQLPINRRKVNKVVPASARLKNSFKFSICLKRLSMFCIEYNKTDYLIEVYTENRQPRVLIIIC